MQGYAKGFTEDRKRCTLMGKYSFFVISAGCDLCEVISSGYFC